MRIHRTCALLLCLVLLGGTGAHASTHVFVEDFTTTTYRDNAATTAQWNTAAGRLELPPHSIVEMGSAPVASPYGVKVRNFEAFVTGNGSQLRIYDVSDPSSPLLTDLVGGFNNPLNLDVLGDYAYVADGDGGMRIVDLNTLSIVGAGGGLGAVDVKVVGNLACVIASSALIIVDVTNPASPVNVGILYIGGSINALDVRGNYCYVANYDLTVVDISDPTAPFVATTLTGIGANDVVVEGNVAYVSSSFYGLITFDVSNPVSPVPLDNLSSVVGYGVAVSGDLAFLGRDFDVLICDVSDPSSISPFTTSPGTDVVGVDTDGEYVYAADYGGGAFRIIEAREPSPLAEVATIDPGLIEDVVVEGNVLYATGSDFHAIDVTDPSAPSLLSTLAMPRPAQDFDVDGNFAYVAAFDSGMYAVDVSDPTAPAIVGHLPRVGSDFHGAAEVEGDICLLGGGGNSTQLHIVDVSDPAAPSLISSYSWPSSQAVDDIAIVGDVAYVTGGTRGLEVIDISNPASPALLGNINSIGNAYSVLVDGGIAYVTSLSDGVYVLDVSNPLSVFVVDLLSTPGSFTTGLARSGSFLFTSADGEGLRMYDVSDPGNITLLPYGAGNNATNPRRMAASGQYVYHAVRFDGLDVMQVMARDVDVEANVARSTPVYSGGDDILAARLTSQRTGDAQWRLSADNGINWYDYPAENVWLPFPPAGSDMRWEVTLGQTQAGVNPAIDQIEIDMAFRYPVILDVTDVGNDQGRQVRITWQFSGFDVPGSSDPIFDYAIYRRIDALPQGAPRAAVTATNDRPAATPAGWDYVVSVPATVENQYSVVVPTLADSTVSQGDYYTTFFVRALTGSPGGYYDSPADSGYSLDNLEPAPPGGFLVAYNGSANFLEWQVSEAEDFDYFRLYRSSDPNFVPSEGNLVFTTAGTTWNDLSGTPGHYYKITAVDFSGNESDPSSPQTATEIGAGASPDAYALDGAVPNPFNPSTVISYRVPGGGGEVEIVVFDVAGRVVRTLVSGPRGAGTHHVEWDGRDDRGKSVSSGVYFYRMTAPGFFRTRKITMLK